MRIFDWKDKNTWPINWRHGFIDEDSDLEWLVELFLSEYDAIRTYHSCRPINIDSYYEYGLLVANYKDLKDHLINNVLGALEINVDNEHIHAAVERLGNTHNNSLFLAVDDRHLLEYCGHYLIYGSEYISALIADIQKRSGQVSLNDLKKIGSPSMIEVNLPLERISGNDLEQFVRQVNNLIDDECECIQYDYTFEIYQPLPPDFIVGHYHPGTINDPLNNN